MFLKKIISIRLIDPLLQTPIEAGLNVFDIEMGESPSLPHSSNRDALAVLQQAKSRLLWPLKALLTNKYLQNLSLVVGGSFLGMELTTLIHEGGHALAAEFYAPNKELLFATPLGCLFSDCESTGINKYFSKRGTAGFVLYPQWQYTMNNGDTFTSVELNYSNANDCPSGDGYRLSPNRELIYSDFPFTTSPLLSQQEADNVTQAGSFLGILSTLLFLPLLLDSPSDSLQKNLLIGIVGGIIEVESRYTSSGHGDHEDPKKSIVNIALTSMFALGFLIYVCKPLFSDDSPPSTSTPSLKKQSLKAVYVARGYVGSILLH
jgi:hypothetical protein